MGKTMLAVHWAHRVAHLFPDGQLYVNLRGFDAGGAVLDPGEAVRGFLDALGVAPAQIPATLDAQVTAFRTLVAGKRILVVLDNARDAEQVRPLLPGAATCLAVVTSRTQLTPLVITEGAQPLSLDLLTLAQGQTLLTARVGAGRIAAESEAAQEILQRCAGLPLALAVIVARLATEPALRLGELAAALRSEEGTLDALTAGDPVADLRVVFSWSYHSLSPGAAALFGLIGLHPGPDISNEAAASLAGLPIARTRLLLTELTRAHLLIHHSYGRYWFHDLLREYALEQVRVQHSEQDSSRATHRLLDHYLHAACTASRLHTPLRPQIALLPPARGIFQEQLADPNAALSWLAAERPVLLAAVSHAFATGFDTQAWQLAWALTTFLDWRGYWDELAAVHRIALQAADRLEDRCAQGHALRGLAFADRARGRHDEARAHFAAAIRVFHEAGDLASTARLRLNFAIMLEKYGDLPEALRQAEQSLAGYLELGDQAGMAHSLNCVGWQNALLGEYERALVHCQRALDLLRELGHLDGQGATLDSLGYTYHHLGDYPQAIAHYVLAMEAIKEMGDRSYEAVILDHLGDSYHAAGEGAQARRVWQASSAIYDELGHPCAATVHAKLARS